MTTTLIQTPRSFLNTTIFDESELIQKCIEEVDHLLLVKPPLGEIYGRMCFQQRTIGFFSDTSFGYRYSNQIMHAKPLTDGCALLLQKINDKFGADFNGILVNKYEGGENYISRHSDNEMNLGNIGVLAISFGAIRTFRIRDKTHKNVVLDLPTNSCEVIHMGGDFQKEFTHEIPIEKKVKGIRYSFTFRKHLC
jgi:alkylated DNA repair dioxygenase AlkB